MELQEEIKRRRKEKWFDVLAAVEALAVSKEVVESALKRHVEKMSNLRNVLVYETEYGETLRVEKPMKNIEEAYSQIVKLRFFAKDFLTLLSVVMTYGPSSIEIMGPDSSELKIDEAQNIVNLLAGVVHQFAAAGVGGMIITPEK